MCCPSCPVAPPVPCWHIPAWIPHYLGGGNKDTVPLHTPMAREAGAGVLVQDGVGGVEQWALLILLTVAIASTPILPSAWLPVPMGRDGGQGATPHKMDG